MYVQHKIKITPSNPTIIEQAIVEKEESDIVHGESVEKKASQGNNKAFKKKSSRSNNNMDRKAEVGPKILKGVGFYVSQDGPDLYLQAIKRLGLYVCTT